MSRAERIEGRIVVCLIVAVDVFLIAQSLKRLSCAGVNFILGYYVTIIIKYLPCNLCIVVCAAFELCKAVFIVNRRCGDDVDEVGYRAFICFLVSFVVLIGKRTIHRDSKGFAAVDSHCRRIRYSFFSISCRTVLCACNCYTFYCCSCQVSAEVVKCNFQRQTEVNDKAYIVVKRIVQINVLAGIALSLINTYTFIERIAVGCRNQRHFLKICRNRLSFPNDIYDTAVYKRIVFPVSAVKRYPLIKVRSFINGNIVIVELSTAVTIINVVNSQGIGRYLLTNIIGDKNSVIFKNLNAADIGRAADLISETA